MKKTVVLLRNTSVILGRRRALAILLLFLAALFLAIDIYGFVAFRHYDVFCRFEQHSPEDFDYLGRDRPLRHYDDGEWLKEELSRAGLTKGNGEQQIIAVQKWIMNQVENDGPVSYAESPRELLLAARNGATLSCGSMSNIAASALSSSGYRVREIQLVKSLFNNADTHVVTEVLIDDKWVIFDPTFNVSYEIDGKLIGIKEIREAVREGNTADIKPKFYGEVAYPARLDSYYINWMPLYNNALVYKQSDLGMWTKIPPIRYWSGPKIYYVAGTHNGLWMVELGKHLYFIFIVVLPVIFVLLVLFAFYLWRSPYKQSLRGGKADMDADLLMLSLDKEHMQLFNSK